MHTWISVGIAIIYFLFIIVFAIAIIMKRRPVGVSLAWLVLLFALPLAGMFVYLVLGSQLLGRKRLKYARSIYPGYHQWRIVFSRLLVAHWGNKGLAKESRLYQFIEKAMEMPALPGNCLELCSESTKMLARIVTDIESAKKSVVLQFYIWWPEGECEKVLAALLKAAGRGVSCKVLVDAVGSRYFLQHECVDMLKKSGVEVEASLPVSPFRMFFERIDVRNHRKLVVIDQHIAWTGSFNLVDPACFKKNLQLGEWVDAMVRVEGPSAYMMLAVFLWDWQMATGAKAGFFSKQPETEALQIQGETYLHVLPSNPQLNRERLHQALLTAIYESEKEIIITTPYFVPDDSLFSALISAAKRGVNVCIILPKTTDSRIARFASRSYYQTLLEAGAHIYLFTTGLLHTKCVLVDRKTVLFGSVNMDMRSVWLNMELTLIIYDECFSGKIALMIAGYKASSTPLDLVRWKKRSFMRRLGESMAQLASPLL